MILYITYDGILEPLGYSQVFQYLREITRRGRFRYTLISYEKKADWNNLARRRDLQRQAKDAGIRWIPLRYHKRPTVPATLFDVAVGFLAGIGLVLGRGIRVVHARSYVAALVALLLKKTLGTRFLFDMRGFWADERVDAGQWSRDSRIYRALKRLERIYLIQADTVVSLTQAGVDEMKKFPYLIQDAPPFRVIPTCTNLELFKPGGARDPGVFVLGYVGSVRGWYLFEPVVECFNALRKQVPAARLVILNRDEHEYIREILAAGGVPTDLVEIRSAAPTEVAREMSKMDATAFFIKPVFSKKASAPTKLGEFLGCGVPCLTNSGVGDLGPILKSEKVGVVVDDFTRRSALEPAMRELVELSRKRGITDRCTAAARKHFALEGGAGSYEEIYAALSTGEKREYLSPSSIGESVRNEGGFRPKVSNILCCYNQAAYVREAVESVLNQTYSPTELVAIDNGSTDGTAAILKEYEKDPRVKLMLHSKNQAVTQRLNEGIAAASGEFISILYSDDFYLPEKTERQIECFAKLPREFGVVYSPGYRLNMLTGAKWRDLSMRKSGWINLEMFTEHHTQGFINPVSPLVRKECFLRYPFRPELFIEGEGIFYRVGMSYQFHYLDEPLVVMRDHLGNAGKAIKSTRKNEAILIDLLLKEPELKEEVRRAVLVYYSRVLRNYGWQAIRLANDPKWARECFGHAIRVRPAQLFHPRTWLGTLLSFLPVAVVSRLNALGNRVRRREQVLAFRADDW